MKKLSIGFRLTVWYLAIFAVAQLAFGAGMWFLLRHHLCDMVDDNLAAQVDDLVKFLQAQKKDASLAKLKEEVTEEYDLEHSGDYLQIYIGNGEWMYRSAYLREHSLAPEEPNTVHGTSFADRKFAGQPFRFITQKVEVNGVVCVAQTGLVIDDLVKNLAMFRTYLLMFAPLLLVIAASGGYWLSRRALAPVDAIVQTARSVNAASLSSRLQKLETGDELQRLVDTLNEMLERIETGFRRITEFTADASHELRTPISLIRTEAELALRRSRGEAEYKDALQHILLEAERTTALVEQLLSLARADSGRESLNFVSVDVRDTLREVVESWRQVATIRDIAFSQQVDGRESFVLGDESALRRVLDILLDNAFKYTPARGSVQLCFEQQAERAVITVRDSGVGIAAGDQCKIFERFYRVDKARSRELQGAGLGLSIAQWIVHQHHGSIAVESEIGKGSTFRVELPLTSPRVRSAMLSM